MRRVECGIKAFDVHELLCHFLAKRLGFYADEGLEVRVVDHTFTPDDRLPERDYFQVACGAAYLSRREGFPFKVVFAATDRPMFWMHARRDIERVEDLAGRRVATYPPVAPPHYFHRVTLRNHGLDPDGDLEFWRCRDDIIRLGMLREGDVDAALVSSAVSPVTVAELGLRTLAFVGDEVRFVTTGIATVEPVLRAQPDLVAALVRAFGRSLTAIHESPSDAIAVIADLLVLSEDAARRTYERYLPAYTRDGRLPVAALDDAVATVGAEVTAGSQVAAADLYDFSILEAEA